MKKLFLSLALVAGFVAVTSAQDKPVSFGVKAGIAFPKMTLSASGASMSFDAKTSFYVGGVANIAVSEIFSVQPGLTYISKGTKISGAAFDFESGPSDAENGTINASYIEIPVNLIASFNAGNAGKVFLGAGPYYAIAIDANAKANGEKQDITIGSDEDNFKRGDYGFNFLAGYQLNNGINIHAGYGLGLGSVIPDQDGAEFKFKNKVFSIGLGFMF